MKKLIVIATIFLIACLVGIGYYAYTIYGTGGGGGGGGGGGTNLFGSGDATGYIWQTLFITNDDGSTYWVQPPKAFEMNNIYGSPDSADNFNKVAAMQNNIYMKIKSTNTIASWTFSCQETIILQDASGNAIGTLVQAQTVNAQGNTLANDQHQWVTGATLPASSLETVIGQVVPTTTGLQYYFAITLSNVQITVTDSQGNTQTLTGNNPTADNTLRWLIAFQA
jgi:hypothetical protein